MKKVETGVKRIKKGDPNVSCSKEKVDYGDSVIF